MACRRTRRGGKTESSTDGSAVQIRGTLGFVRSGGRWSRPAGGIGGAPVASASKGAQPHAGGRTARSSRAAARSVEDRGMECLPPPRPAPGPAPQPPPPTHPDEVDGINARRASPPAFDPAHSDRSRLFVISRLAVPARHQVSMRRRVRRPMAVVLMRSACVRQRGQARGASLGRQAGEEGRGRRNGRQRLPQPAVPPEFFFVFGGEGCVGEFGGVGGSRPGCEERGGGWRGTVGGRRHDDG